ncbi:hypothetical protein ABL78_0040 [Leptomonas seymouri]|uniref:Nudix hydrolase domain-containing protein n=1 Tax=Leptomonas seymouri TaxID=5684 RepID=A0A0N0P9K0_LEPSE|nr:hypothetical protein ABL78_0040 [Leptomonas seymouri]|eukprot:KPI90807.1 hypothetical protein ABL78_0040 [Leptomonas seymouri]
MQAPSRRPKKTIQTNIIIRGADGHAYRRSVQPFFINEKGQFLICCLVGGSNRCFRQTVQGGSEVGETPMETAVRETWEELGLDITQCAVFIGEVLPISSLPPSNLPGSRSSAEAPPVLTIDQVELSSEDRAAFRYPSKNWRKQGIHGQEMYPLLFFLPSHDINKIQVNSQSRGVRQEFNAVYWGSLVELEQSAPPVKQHLMSNVCPAVAAAALPFCWANGYSFEGIAAYSANAVA